ncbi:MAG TPA: phosphotransferase [Rugosimonospora sp.]
MTGLTLVDEALASVPLLAGHPVRWSRMPGGLSHQVYRVDVDTDGDEPGRAAGGTGQNRYVLRILDPAVSDAGLGIPPEQELDNTRRAAESGVGARVLAVLPELPALLLEYLPGRTLGPGDVAGAIGPIASACRRLHAGPAFGNDFDISRKRAELLTICERHGLAVPAGYRAARSAVDDVARALAAWPPPPVPCHNDLLAENLIVDQPAGEPAGASAGEPAGVRIVDYQLSGNNDPTFDLGDIAAEADFDPDQCGALAAAYFGPDLTEALVARVRLQLLLSNATWTLWFSVHHGLLRPGTAFDYRSEADDKWRQALRDLNAPELGALIDAVAGRRPDRRPTLTR